MASTRLNNCLSKLSGQLCDSKTILSALKFGGVKSNRFYTVPPPGSGVGKGGGAGGSIRESGGGLGQYGAAQEEEYFFNKRREQLAKIRSQMKKEQKSPEITRKEEK